jgi:S1-C subfamily serine protease
VVIVATIADGPAAAAGLLPGDVIYELNNQPIRNLKELMEAGRALAENQAAVLLIERSGQLQFVQVDID